MRSTFTLLFIACAVILASVYSAFRTPHSALRTPQEGTEAIPPSATMEILMYNLDRPVAMAFDPQGRLFYTEKQSGKVRLYAYGVLQANAVITFSIDGDFESGLLGIAIDPNFNTNRYIYVYLSCDTASGCPNTQNRVVRFVENNGVGSNPTPLISFTRTADQHNGGSIHFGPDGKLYVGVGDGANPANAQNGASQNGKLHRFNADGTIPADNPVFTQTGVLPSIYAIGLRNPFDFAFDSVVPGRIFAGENGPGWDDELNRIVGGYNYGWRDNYPIDEDNNPNPQYNTIPPMWYVDEGFCCESPTGVIVYNSNQIPEWRNQLFMAGYNHRVLRHFYLDGARTAITATNVVLGTEATLSLTLGPEGGLYYFEGGGYEVARLKRIVGKRVAGHVDWQGRPSQPNTLQQVPITLTLKLGATEQNSPTQTTDASGFLTVGVGSLVPGAYNWRVKGTKHLATSGSANLSGSPLLNVEMGLMKPGDCNNDNIINAQDFIILKPTFGKSLGDLGYDDRAEFTGDNVVNVVDFNWLKANFGQSGAPSI